MANPPSFSQMFTAVAHKRLVTVDLTNKGSHQHELNGTEALKSFFEHSEETRGQVSWIRFSGDTEPDAVTGSFKFYDARAKGRERTGRGPEWRFYYSGEPLADASPGDLLVLARTIDEKIFALVFEKDSGWERSALALFPIGDAGGRQLEFVSSEHLASTDLNLVRRTIIEQLGFDYVVPPQPDLTDLVLSRFGLAFPPTAEMGTLARDLAPSEADDDPDKLLLLWIDTEEQLFRALERLIVSERIESGFADVDDFLSFSLSVQNRRKSRMGHAFEHHLAAIFDLNGIRYSRQVVTEGNRTADFVFPGRHEYADPSFPAQDLAVLAAKSTCKDRWPQVLADADRVRVKHLGTLDTALSGQQLRDMLSKDVVPVIPTAIRSTYGGDSSFARILNMAEFIELVRQ